MSLCCNSSKTRLPEPHGLPDVPSPTPHLSPTPSPSYKKPGLGSPGPRQEIAHFLPLLPDFWTMQAFSRQFSKDVLHTLICTDSHSPARIRLPATSSIVPPGPSSTHLPPCNSKWICDASLPSSTGHPVSCFQAHMCPLVVFFSWSHLLPDEYALRCQLKEGGKKVQTTTLFYFSDKLKPACHPSRLAPAAALIRGNRNNCTQFSNNLDWLVSKLERLESSSGAPAVTHCFLKYTLSFLPAPPHPHSTPSQRPKATARLIG